MSDPDVAADRERAAELLREIQERANELHAIIERNRDRNPFSRFKVTIHKLVGPANSLPERWREAIGRRSG